MAWDDWFSDPGGLTEFFGSDPGGLTDFFGGDTAGGINDLSSLFDPGGLGQFGSNLMVFDNQTGQTIPFSQAMQIDPQAAQAFIGPLLSKGAAQGGRSLFGGLTGA